MKSRKPTFTELAQKTRQLEVETARLQHSEKINRTLFRISNAVSTTFRLDDLYASIHRALGEVVDVTNFYIAIYHKEKNAISFPYFKDEVDKNYDYIENFTEINSLTGDVILARKPLFLTHDILLKKAAASRIQGCVPKIWLGVPLNIKNQVIGVIAIQSYTDPDHFNQMDLDILTAVSDQVAVAIERTRMQEVMVQTEKMISVGGLAAGMAHEINNPLAGILQSLQVIRNRLKGDLPANKQLAAACGLNLENLEDYMEQRGIFAMIDAAVESGKRATKIVNNMLSFSRKSDADQDFHDLALLLDESIALAESDYDLKKRYDFRKIKIVRDYDADVPPVPCESSQIQQVFLNILKNSAHALMQKKSLGLIEGGAYTPRIHLRTTKDGDMVRVEIADNGPGMNKSAAKRVFEPFFTTKEVGNGTGLGLSLSYFIITENHSGTISVHSAPGKNTRFVIRLPMKMRAARRF